MFVDFNRQCIYIFLGAGCSITDNLNEIDLLAMQWLWISSDADVTLATTIQIGDVWAVHLQSEILTYGALFIMATSLDVIHSATLPTLQIRYDIIPGRLTGLVTKHLIPGYFTGQCSELCGILHGLMPIANLA